MMVSLTVSALWLLGMLAAVAHAQDGARTAAGGLRAAATFVAVVPGALWLTPQPNWIAVLLAAGVFWRLIAGPLPRAGAFLAGASAALVAALLIGGGVAYWLVLPVTALGLGWGLLLGGEGLRRRHEALLVIAALAIPPVGLANDIVYGWHSATVLSREAAEIDAVAMPAWAMAIVGAALLAGLVKGMWIKR